MPLLDPADPSPITITNAGGASPFVLIGDHAGDGIPRRLGMLGLADADRRRHIALDIGINGLGVQMASLLDAPFVAQRYSRLVIDCNRDPERPDAIADISDGTIIPGNQGLSATDRAERIAAIHAPYQNAIADTLNARDAAGAPVILVALHSFTPRMAGFDRPWHCGVLHDGGDSHFARHVLDLLRGVAGLVVGDNEPYSMAGTDHSVPRHAYARRRPYVEFEVRQDLIADAAGQAQWAARLSGLLSEAAKGWPAG